jgi:hypothetical protein
MQHIIIIDASTGRAVIVLRGLSEEPEDAFMRIAKEEGMREQDCEWQEVDKVEVRLS